MLTEAIRMLTLLAVLLGPPAVLTIRDELRKDAR